MQKLEFKKFTDFPIGTIYDLLCDAYSYDERNKKIWDSNWKESDLSFMTENRMKQKVLLRGDFLYYEIVL